MLADWYFCTAIQIPLQQAVAHMRMMAALRDGLVPELLVTDDLLAEVLDEAAAAGPWQQLHALAPALAVTRARPARPVAQAAHGFCEHLLDACLGGDGAAMRESLRAILQRAIDRPDDGGLAAEIITVADRNLAEPPVARAAAVPYLDLVDFAIPTIVLSVLDAISRSDAGRVRECATGVDRTPWFSRALEGRYGRQALLLSVAIAARAGDQDAPSALTRPESGVIDMEPDLLACYARALFAGRNDPAGTRLAEFEVEAITGRSLPQPLRHDGAAREAVSHRISGQAAMSRALGPIVWHVAMWDLALECDPADCAERLRRWWGAPPDLTESPFAASEPIRVSIPLDYDHAIRQRMQHMLRLRLHDLRLTVSARLAADKSKRAAPDAAGKGPAPATDEPQLRLAHGELNRTAYRFGAALFSPWAYRKSPNPGRGFIEPAAYPDRTQFPGLDDPVAIIRLLAGVALAVRVARAQPEDSRPPFHLMSLIIHGKDVVADCRFKPIRDAAEVGSEPAADLMAFTHLPRSVNALVNYVDRVVDHAGKGSFERITPESLARFLVSRSFGVAKVGDHVLSIQERHLSWYVAPAIAVTWIKEVLSGYSGQDGGIAEPRWFRAMASGESPALLVLTRSVERDRSQVPRQAATVLLQLAPDRFDELRGHKPGWNWYDKKDQIQGDFKRNIDEGRPELLVLNMNVVLCAPRYTADQWGIATPLIARWLADPPGESQSDGHRVVRTAMLAARLDAVLRDPEATFSAPHDQWLSAFLDKIRAMASVKELPRELRELMINWIPGQDPRSAPLPVPGLPAPQRLTELQHLDDLLTGAIDTVTLFSQRTPRYLLLLMDRLRKTTLPEGMANDQRLRLVYAMLQFHENYDDRLARTGPEGRLGEQFNARQVSSALARFLLSMAGQPLLRRDATLGDAFLALWHALHVDPSIRALPRPLGEPGEPSAAGAQGGQAADGWHAAVVIDRYRDLRIEYPMAVDTRSASIRGVADDEPVESFFALSPPERDSAAGSRTLLAVVVGQERYQHTDADVVVLNCGTGEPVRVAVATGTAPGAGELRAVRVSRDNAADPWTAHSVHALARARPRHGERRSASVTELPVFPWLRVTVDGADVYPDDDEAAATSIRLGWDPDLTRGLRTHSLASGAGDADRTGNGGPTVTPAYFDEMLGWLPVDRGLTEFLGTVTGDGLVEMTKGGLADDDYGRIRWRFTTRPGFNYLFSATDWADSAAAETVGGFPAGSRVQVGIDTNTALLRLVPYVDGRLADQTNWGWSQAFAGKTDLTAIAEHGDHVTEVTPPLDETLLPGLPWRIPVDGLTPADVLFEVAQWGEYEQRRGRVLGTPLTSFDLVGWEDPGRHRLRDLQNIRDGDRVQLAGLIKLNPEGLSDARDKDGIAVKVNASSLSLLPLGKDPRFRRSAFIKGRSAEVRVRDRGGLAQTAVPLSRREFSDALEAHGNGPVNIDGVTTIRGVIVRRLQSRESRRGRQYWGLWLDASEPPRYCEIPGSAFRALPRWPGLGDLVTAELGRSGWTFRAHGREIRAAASYRLLDIEKIPKRRQQTVGYEVDGWRVVQDKEQPVLACVRAHAGERMSFALMLAKATVRQAGAPFGPNQALRRAVAEFGDGGVISGVTEAYDENNQAASLRDVRIRFNEGRGSQEVFVDRDLVCELRPRTQAQGVTQAEINYFLELEQRGEEIVLTGTLVRGGIRFGQAVRLPDGSYARIVPRVDNDGPWIALDEDNEYGNSAHAILVREGDGFRASCRQAPPLSLEQFWPRLGTKTVGGPARYPTPNHFSYVGAGTDADGHPYHLFEWGHGETLKVPDQQLTRRSADGGTFSLFHGDRVTAVTVERHADALVMAIDPSAIRLGLPGRVFEEASVGIVHQLRVEILPETGKVRVRSVLTGRRDYAGGWSQASHKPIKAQLNKKSVERLLEMAPAPSAGPVIRDILARLEDNLYNGPVDGQGRNVSFIYVPAQQGSGPESLGQDETLHKGDRLFLLSGQTVQTKTGNDVYVEFAPPGESGTIAPTLKVEVFRRQYSYREDVLSRLHELQVAGQAVEAQVMAVTLLEPPQRPGLAWTGITKWSPPRSRAQLATFLAMQSGRSYLAILGEDDRRQRCLEVEPGAVFSGIRLPAGIEPGAVVRLTLRADRREIDAELAVPSDLSYLLAGQSGRAVVVMPKTTLLRSGAIDLLTPDRSARDYTIAGLPGIEARAAAELSKAIITRPHPKTALATRSGMRVELGDLPESVPAGRVAASARHDAVTLAPLAGPGRPFAADRMVASELRRRRY